MSPVSHQNKKWLLVVLAYADLRADRTTPADAETIHMLDYLFHNLMHCEVNDDKYTIYFTIGHAKFQCDEVNNKTMTAGATQVYKVCSSPLQPINELQLVHHAATGLHTREDISSVLLFIRQHASNEYQHTCIITCGHGSAFGIFKKRDLNIPEPAELQQLNAPIHAAAWAKYLSSQPVYQPAGDMLSNEALAGAVRDCLGKTDIVVMMNCYMANLHTAYAFTGCTKYLVAPQGAIRAPGFNIPAIVAYLCETASVTTRDLAHHCVDTAYCGTFIAQANEWNLGTLHTDERALFAMDLDFADTEGRDIAWFAGELNNLVHIMQQAMLTEQEIKYLFKYARRYSFDFSSGKCQMVDVVNWLLQVQYASAEVIYSPLAIPLATFLGNASRFTNGFCYKHDNYRGTVYRSTYGAVTCHEPTGMSLWFPTLSQDYHSFYASALSAQLTNWESFLAALNNA